MGQEQVFAHELCRLGPVVIRDTVVTTSRELERQAEESALSLAAAFASRLLSRVAGQALEARLVEMLIEDLPNLSDAHRQALADKGPAVRVKSAYPLSQDQREAIRSALEAAAGHAVRVQIGQDPELIAGLRIDAGPLVMRANLRDELRLFVELQG